MMASFQCIFYHNKKKNGKNSLQFPPLLLLKTMEHSPFCPLLRLHDPSPVSLPAFTLQAPE